MPDKSHWPFGADEGEGAAREHDRSVEREREREAHSGRWPPKPTSSSRATTA